MNENNPHEGVLYVGEAGSTLVDLVTYELVGASTVGPKVTVSLRDAERDGPLKDIVYVERELGAIAEQLSPGAYQVRYDFDANTWVCSGIRAAV